MCAHVRIVENTLKIQQHIDAMCTYIYIYICVCVCIKMLERSMSIYIYIQLYYIIYGDGSKPWHLVNIKIAGKWMFIPLKMVLIGIDPYPYIYILSPSVVVTSHFASKVLRPQLPLACYRSISLGRWFPPTPNHRSSFHQGSCWC